MNAKTLSPLLLVGTSLIYAACGGDNLTLPSEGEAAHIVVKDGSDQQSGRVGTALEAPLVVKVTDTQDRPVAGAKVEFTFDDASAGSSNPASDTTDANGEASAVITLGSKVGPVTGHATVPVPQGTVPVTTTFTAMALAADANGIAMVSGDGQQGAVSTTLPQPLVVQVSDNFGNPIPGVTVDWSVTGGGSVSQASTVTDGNGQASVERTLGSTAGDQTTLAAAAGLAGSPVTFTHTATAGNASRVVKVSGDGQTGAPGAELGQPLVVQVLDANDNPIVGVAVTWVVGAGDGSVTPASSQTDGQGKSSVRWTLGADPGSNTVTAVVSGVGTARFTAMGGKLASTTQITGEGDDPSTVGQTVRITFSVTGPGGTPTGTVNVTVSGGPETCSGTVQAGFCELTFTVPGNQREILATYSGDARYNGSSDTERHRVVPVSSNEPPTARFTSNSPCELSCSFQSQSGDDDGSIVALHWDFGDGQSADNVVEVTHTYAQPNTYHVTLTVTDDDGATNSVTHDVIVTASNTPPVAEFSFTCTGFDCAFTDESTDNGNVTAWEWNFGDGSSSTDRNPSHLYLASGTYQVTLIVTDDANVKSEPHQEDVTVPQ